jgi:hypothetical protein
LTDSELAWAIIIAVAVVMVSALVILIASVVEGVQAWRERQARRRR